MSVITEESACAPSTAHAIGVEPAVALAAVLKALADPLRLRILSAIAADPRGESCVCDLTGLAEVSQPTISHHLRVLKEVGLLESERRGTWVWYRLVEDRRDAVGILLDRLAPALLAPAAAMPAPAPHSAAPAPSGSMRAGRSSRTREKETVA